MVANDNDLEQPEVEKPEELEDANEELLKVGDKFNVEVCNIIYQAQQEHGLKHDNYQRYREYCTRRLKRLRKVLNFKMGDKRKVNPKKVTEDNFNDPRFVMLLVMSSERAWSHAMELKNDPRENKDRSKKFHMIKRLRRAVKYANEVYELCKESKKVNARTKLETQAYCAYINGVFGFEFYKKEELAKALVHFTSAKTIYTKLHENLTTSEDRLPYKNMLDKNIKPSLKYCEYTSGKVGVEELLQYQDQLPQIEQLVSEAKTINPDEFREILWRDENETIPVKQNKVRILLKAMNEYEDDISKATSFEKKLNIYGNYFSDINEALQIVKDDVKNDQHSNNDTVLSTLEKLCDYLKFKKYTNTIEKCLIQIEQSKESNPYLKLDFEKIQNESNQNQNSKQVKIDFMIRLYNQILSNLNDISKLRVVNELDHLKPEIKTVVNLKKPAFEALRCYYAALSSQVEKK